MEESPSEEARLDTVELAAGDDNALAEVDNARLLEAREERMLPLSTDDDRVTALCVEGTGLKLESVLEELEAEAEGVLAVFEGGSVAESVGRGLGLLEGGLGLGPVGCRRGEIPYSSLKPSLMTPSGWPIPQRTASECPRFSLPSAARNDLGRRRAACLKVVAGAQA